MEPPTSVLSTKDFESKFPRESTHVEFKTGMGSKPLQEAAVALSNSGGGSIFIGVDNDGAITGKRLDQGSEESINQVLLAAHSVGRFSVNALVIDGKEIIQVGVQPRNDGFAQTSDGRTLVRRGPRNHALVGAELQDFVNRRSLRRFEATDSELDLEAIDGALLKEFQDTMGWSPADGISDRLTERGLAQSGTLTMAGAFFLTNPDESLGMAKAAVEVRRYKEEGVNYDRREIFSGPLHHQVRDASQFIIDELGSDLVVSGLYRYDLPKLPAQVVREAIANAVAHRSYEQDTATTLVEIRPGAVTIRSPGTLPEPVTIQTLRLAQAARNPTVIETLRSFSLAEDAGRGIDVIQDSMRDEMLDAPVFEEIGNFLTVTLPLSSPITVRERAWLRDLERRGAIEGFDRLLVVHAARGETLTNAVARELLATDDSGTARRALKRLCDAGILEQQGSRGSARYRLADAVAPPAAYRMDRDELGDLVVEEAALEAITNRRVREITGLDRIRARNLLSELVSQGRLVQHGEKRGTRYVPA